MGMNSETRTISIITKDRNLVLETDDTLTKKIYHKAFSWLKHISAQSKLARGEFPTESSVPYVPFASSSFSRRSKDSADDADPLSRSDPDEDDRSFTGHDDLRKISGSSTGSITANNYRASHRLSKPSVSPPKRPSSTNRGSREPSLSSLPEAAAVDLGMPEQHSNELPIVRESGASLDVSIDSTFTMMGHIKIAETKTPEVLKAVESKLSYTHPVGKAIDMSTINDNLSLLTNQVREALALIPPSDGGSVDFDDHEEESEMDRQTILINNLNLAIETLINRSVTIAAEKEELKNTTYTETEAASSNSIAEDEYADLVRELAEGLRTRREEDTKTVQLSQDLHAKEEEIASLRHMITSPGPTVGVCVICSHEIPSLSMKRSNKVSEEEVTKEERSVVVELPREGDAAKEKGGGEGEGQRQREGGSKVLVPDITGKSAEDTVGLKEKGGEDFSTLSSSSSAVKVGGDTSKASVCVSSSSDTTHETKPAAVSSERMRSPTGVDRLRSGTVLRRVSLKIEADANKVVIGSQISKMKARELCWTIFSYSSQSTNQKFLIEKMAEGRGGLEEVVGYFTADIICYAVVSITCDSRISSLFTTWIGASVGGLKKAKVSFHETLMLDIVRSEIAVSAVVRASSKGDIEPTALWSNALNLCTKIGVKKADVNSL
jgi:hypothetical protein